MSYWDISNMVSDFDLRSRINACVAQEDPGENPAVFTETHIWLLCADPAWSTAWSAAVGSANPSPGQDEAVISDAMILAQVQAVLAAATPPAGP